MNRTKSKLQPMRNGYCNLATLILYGVLPANERQAQYSYLFTKRIMIQSCIRPSPDARYKRSVSVAIGTI